MASFLTSFRVALFTHFLLCLIVLFLVVVPGALVSGAPRSGSRLWGAAAMRRVGRRLGARGRPRKHIGKEVKNVETQTASLTEVVTQTEAYGAVMSLHQNVMFLTLNFALVFIAGWAWWLALLPCWAFSSILTNEFFVTPISSAFEWPLYRGVSVHSVELPD